MFYDIGNFDRKIMLNYFPLPVCGKTPVRHSALQILIPIEFILASCPLSNANYLINSIDVDRVEHRIKSSIAQSVLNQFLRWKLIYETTSQWSIIVSFVYEVSCHLT
jgi:hypothetical protein